LRLDPGDPLFAVPPLGIVGLAEPPRFGDGLVIGVA
jgi:hypothetical protein